MLYEVITVAESWIVKENDAVFPDEPVGSWAVAIKLEDEELKKSVKNGDIAGISMAGTATKVEDDNSSVEKADEKTFSFNDVIGMFKKIFGSTHVSISGSAYNNEVNKSNVITSYSIHYTKLYEQRQKIYINI